jgi:hypothetical protein
LRNLHVKIHTHPKQGNVSRPVESESEGIIGGVESELYLKIGYKSKKQPDDSRGGDEMSYKFTIIHTYEGVGVGNFKNRGVGLGVGAFVYRLHSPERK